ncbi:MAG: hypothetical protein IJH34_10830 [Romboutsia sp.]|nr:hypothetical protein [Romboutsia sp.]
MMFVCFFLPAVVAVAVYDNLYKKRLKTKQVVYNYALYNVLINLITNIAIILMKSGEVVLNTERFTSRFTSKYLIIAFLLSIILGIVVGYIRETFKFEVSIEKMKVKKDEK